MSETTMPEKAREAMARRQWRHDGDLLEVRALEADVLVHDEPSTQLALAAKQIHSERLQVEDSSVEQATAELSRRLGRGRGRARGLGRRAFESAQTIIDS